MRSALRATAAHGYYVFDELMTEEAGTIDFLAVGPVGACVIVVREEEGDVTADVDGALYLNGRCFEDDPKRQAEDLVAAVNSKLADTGAHTYHVVCFTRAELYYLGENPDETLKGICPTWDLALPFASAPTAHTPADVAELADRISEAYGRPPFVIPEGVDAR
ncbi:nuclease-related domain-containing protein [Rubrobacter marinus]|uniref:nuclease-related domain-containing protein n=1 Tax=Rubrobacter marinus TaxID=2653852 RepID=UPI00140E9365|nr:nuclease-related domain-containing protein [Rubrobacter marinus]